MASIPILAAVAAAIIVPVAGTGIYYSVRPAKQKEGEVSAEIERRLQSPRLNDRGRAMDNSGSSLLQIDRIEQRGESMKEFEERAGQEKNEAKASIEKLLENNGSLDLSSNFPSVFGATRSGNWASPHSSSFLRRP